MHPSTRLFLVEACKKNSRSFSFSIVASLELSRTERVNSIHDLNVFGSPTLATAWHANWIRGSKAGLLADRPIVSPYGVHQARLTRRRDEPLS